MPTTFASLPSIQTSFSSSLPQGSSMISPLGARPHLGTRKTSTTLRDPNDCAPDDLDPDENAELYVNLLVFEEAMRRGYVDLQRRKRKYMVFFAGLLLWNAYFSYGTMIDPSPYYYISLFHTLSLLLGLVTLSLYFFGGYYHSTIAEPRKFLPYANRTLRGMNLRLVVVPRGAWWTVRDWLPCLFPPFSWRRKKKGEERPPMPPERREVRLVVGGRVDADIREGWDTYQLEYWENRAEEGIPESDDEDDETDLLVKGKRKDGSVRGQSRRRKDGSMRKKKVG
ncbi:Nem1-Spo7 phosphatase regulatory subunit [Saitoella coloradoensis]